MNEDITFEALLSRSWGKSEDNIRKTQNEISRLKNELSRHEQRLEVQIMESKQLDRFCKDYFRPIEDAGDIATVSWNDITDRPTDLSMIDPARAAKIDATDVLGKLQRRGLDGYETKGGGQ